MELFTLLLTIGSFSIVVESTTRSCTSISRIEKINSKVYNLKCQNSDEEIFNIEYHSNYQAQNSEVVIKCNYKEKDNSRSDEVNKNDFLSNDLIKNAKHVQLVKCSWNQLQPLFSTANDGLFKDLKNNLTYVKLEGVTGQYEEVELPAVLSDFFPNVDHLVVWHMDKVITTGSGNQTWPPKLNKLEITNLNSSYLPIFSNSNITDLYLDKGRYIVDLSNLRFLEKLVTFTIYINDALEELNGGIFKNHSALKTLKIHRATKLSEISSNAFNGLTSLEDFILDGSKVQNISSDLFKKCSSLRDVKLLDNNLLCHLSDYFLPKNIQSFTLEIRSSSSPSICENAGGVKISSNAFTNAATQLENLELVGAKLNYKELIEDLNLKNFKNLKRLDLRYNKISEIKAASDFPTRHLEFLDLRYQNPLLKYSEALEKLTVKCIAIVNDKKVCHKLNHLDCDCKNSSTIKEILCLNQNTSVCQTAIEPQQTLIIVLIPLAIVIILSCIFIVVVYDRMRYFFYTQPFCYKLCFYVTEPNSDDADNLTSHEVYDAFILHCDTSYCECRRGVEENNDGKENEIVLELINKLTYGSLGRKFKVASKDHFVCGKPESLNLQELVQSSKRIIVLLSESFLHSPYHVGEFRQIAAINRERYVLFMS